MGLFHHKQQPTNNAQAQTPSSDISAQDQFLDEYFREELRNRGRWYFEKVITENGDLFKKDLDATITSVKTELDEHVTRQVDEAVRQVDEYLKAHVTRKLDEQFVAYNDALKKAQDDALQTVTESTKQLQQQHNELKEALTHSVTEQTAILHSAFEENKADITTMKETQAQALAVLKQSAAQVEEQYAQLSSSLRQTVESQKEMILKSFESNMAEVVEHYVLGALGDQFDLKSQLPAIIKQMEANKAAMAEDLRL